MTRKKHRARKIKATATSSTNRDPLQSWIFRPLYGLKISADDGLEFPIFGDATLVSMEWHAQQIQQRFNNPAMVSLLTYQPMDKYLPNMDWTKYPPKEQLVELPPHSYMAVRRDTPEQASQYGELIRAMLTAAMFLRGNRAGAFATRPVEVSWSREPRHIRFLSDGSGDIGFEFTGNEIVYRNPITVSKQALRDSWASGSDILFGNGATWDIHSEHPICKLLIGSRSRSPRERRLCALAIHLARSCCILNPMSQIQMAVTGMEMAFETNKFDRLKKLFFSRFPTSENRSDFARIEKARHEFVHQGEILDTQTASNLARVAFILAYTTFDIALSYVDEFPDTSSYVHFLDFWISTYNMAEILEGLHGMERRKAFQEEVMAAFRLSNARLTRKLQR